MPVVSDDHKRFTVRIKPGIFFADDPAFGGKKRELTAADYVYSIKRHYDPRWKSSSLSTFENAKLLGLSELRQRAIAEKRPFDYDTEVAGLRALDRHTFEIRLAEPAPNFLYNLVGSVVGALAREVVEAHGDKIGEHPVGTGPFRLAQWKRSSRIVLDRNPGYREVRYDENPPADDAQLQAIADKFRGRKLPMIDRVEVSIIEEVQPRWLAFLNAEQDLIENVPAEFVNLAVPNGKLAPNLAKRGIGLHRYARSDISMTYFAMEHPVVGGNAPEKVALRRAISLAVDVEREIRLARRGQAVPAQSIIGPHTSGYDPAFKSEMSEYNPARAKALLELHGYVDRDGDGWREQPDGQPLVLQISTQPDQQSRQLNELRKKDLDAVGLRAEFKTAKWPENLKAGRSGKLQIWALASGASGGDGQGMITRYFGPQAGNQNIARFRLPALDALHERMTVLPDGPERLQLFEQAKKIAVAYMPYKLHTHRLVADMMQPGLAGWRRPLFWNEWWHFVDAEPGPSPA
jgi:ABC-type transport system substrate-binding protein